MIETSANLQAELVQVTREVHGCYIQSDRSGRMAVVEYSLDLSSGTIEGLMDDLECSRGLETREIISAGQGFFIGGQEDGFVSRNSKEFPVVLCGVTQDRIGRGRDQNGQVGTVT